uniref:Uncharacterized protein n=1 Tax=Tanacetum cinerariifolium TaxID=118510 RepID=A0A6L2L1D9_TANCI|nr:hypothetical protein [Tanacetum cinerariifolium]
MPNLEIQEWKGALLKALVQSARALYSASVELLDTTYCFLDCQEIKHGPRNTQKPVIDLFVTGQLVQLLSQTLMRASKYGVLGSVEGCIRKRFSICVIEFDVLINGHEDLALKESCESLSCELSVVSSGCVLWTVCVSFDKGVFGSVSFGKELVVSGSVVCEVCGGVRYVVVSSMVVVEGGLAMELLVLEVYRGLDGSQLIKYAAASIQYPQKCIGKFAWDLKALATSNMCLCFLSTLAFCCGVYGHVVWWTIPFVVKNSVKDSQALHAKGDDSVGVTDFVGNPSLCFSSCLIVMYAFAAEGMGCISKI